jgi:hypothetical protein
LFAAGMAGTISALDRETDDDVLATDARSHPIALAGVVRGPAGNNDFFVRWLLGVNPPDWNSGHGAPAYGFFDSPSDEKPPFWWW